MSRVPLWAVLAPGEPTRLASRVRIALMLDEDEADGTEPSFEIIQGSGPYHAIVGFNLIDIGVETQLAEEISLECDEPVYSIEQASDAWTILSFRKGVEEIEEVSPEALAKSLGCPLPGGDTTSEGPARTPLRTVALIEGVSTEEARRALEEDYGEPLPAGHYHFKDTPQGFVLSGGTGGMNFAHITLSERFPHATVYGVTASPALDEFSTTVIKGGEGIEEFSHPPQAFPSFPVASNIKGESSPERILAALGIPAEWFRKE